MKLTRGAIPPRGERITLYHKDANGAPVGNSATTMGCEPQLFSDLKEGLGIVLTGGGSLLRGLDKFLSKEMGIPVRLADNPKTATIEGVGVVLGEIDYLAKNRKK